MELRIMLIGCILTTWLTGCCAKEFNATREYEQNQISKMMVDCKEMCGQNGIAGFEIVTQVDGWDNIRLTPKCSCK